MDVNQFQALIAGVTGKIAGLPLDAALATRLNAELGPDSAGYKELFAACQAAIAAGWMCNREAGGIRFGRVIQPNPATHGFSVDVVDMEEVVGPHHVHPEGEVDLIMPLTPNAQFDGHPAGWCVYGPGSAHRPTVAGGRALVLYLLPQGAIQFTPG